MTLMSSNLMFRYWSTDLSVPRIEMSFFSSMVTGVSMRVLKKLQDDDGSQPHRMTNVMARGMCERN